MRKVKKLFLYFNNIRKSISQKPSWSSIKDMIRFYPSWLSYLSSNRNSVADKMPWLCFGAIDFIKQIVKKDFVVFEYGSGGSTLFWSQRVNKVISIEHDKEWYEKMATEFQKLGINNVDYKLMAAENDDEFTTKSIGNPKHYISDDIMFKGKKFESYTKQIDSFPDSYFDVIVVDGRARPSCILHAQNKLKKGGYLIIDNTERGYYTEVFSFNKPLWDVRKFYGPVPYIGHFSETSVLKKQ